MLSLVNKEDDFNDEVEVKELCPEPPDWMSYEAKCEWLRAAEDLFKKGRLVGGNISLFENYCILIGFVRECEQRLAEDGKIINCKPHPAFKMMLDSMAQAKSIASEIKFVKDNSQENEDQGGDWGKDKKLLA